MSEERTEYLVYGDDHRVEQEQLDALAEQADRLMEIRHRAISKKREKERVIPKPSVEDTKYTEDPSEDLADIDDEEYSEPAAAETAEPEPVTAKKKKRKPKPLFFILIGVVAAAVILTAVSLLKKPKDSSTDAVINNTPAPAETSTPEDSGEPTTEPEDNTSTETSPAPAATEGYLKLIDESKEYALSDTLAFAKSINEVTQNYLNKAADEVQAYLRDQTKIIREDMATLRLMLDYDIETLKTYETMFDTYGGVDYIRNAEERMNNAAAMYDAIGEDYASTADLVSTANEYITSENAYAQKAKDSLLAYLDSNGVVYHLEDDQINYDSMQFINNTNEEPEPDIEQPAETPAENPDDSGM